MALDILGPASALNSVTTRPAQTTTYGATRTWFKACTSLTAQDGTQLTNDWLNNMLAQLRTAYDGIGITEDNSDGMLLACFTAVRDYYLIDTAVTFTVHGAGANFTDLGAAFEYLSKYRITSNGSVTLSIAAGAYSYSGKELLFDHPNLDRIAIVGAAMLRALPASIPVSILALTGSNSTHRAADSATDLTTLRTYFATEIDLGTGSSINVTQTGMNILAGTSAYTGFRISNILFVGDGSAVGSSGMIDVAGCCRFNSVAVCGSGGHGILVDHGAIVLDAPLYLTGNAGCGLALTDGGSFNLNSYIIVTQSNGQSGIGSIGNSSSQSNGGAVQAQGNGIAGAACNMRGSLDLGSAGSFSNNAGNGLSATTAGFISAPSATIGSNGAQGAVASDGATIVCGSSAFSGNTVDATYAAGESTIDATAATGVSGNSSPAINTVGNTNSIVIN